MEFAYLYTCRCELISFLHIRVLQNLQTKDVEEAHTLCVYNESNNFVITISMIPNQSYIKRANGVYVSDRIIFDGSGKTVCKVMGETELDVDSKWPLTFFRYLPFSRLFTDLNNNTLTFLSPTQWDDPFESAFYGLYKQHNVKCLCFTYNGSIGEEWAWKAYKSSERLVRIEILFDKLVNTLSKVVSENNGKWTFYISVCDYSMDKKDIVSLVKSAGLSGLKLNLESYLNVMSLKRKAFSTEREIRIFAVSDVNGIDSAETFDNIDYKSFVSRVLLEPLPPFSDSPQRKEYPILQKIYNAGINEYFSKLKIKTQQSHLYEIK